MQSLPAAQEAQHSADAGEGKHWSRRCCSHSIYFLTNILPRLYDPKPTREVGTTKRRRHSRPTSSRQSREEEWDFFPHRVRGMRAHRQAPWDKPTLQWSHDGHTAGPSLGDAENLGGKPNCIWGGADDSLHAAPPQAPLRGIYLRPTVFMIGGTATHLMEVLYPPTAADAAASAAATASPLPATAARPTWWGHRTPHSLESWVSFEYSLARIPAPPAASKIATKTPGGCTEEELVREFPPALPPAASEQWLAVAKQMSLSLRENRLLAPFRLEYCGAVENPSQPSQVTLPLGGDEQGLTPGGSVLLGGVEVALRAMRPGEEFAFLIKDSKYSDDTLSAYGSHYFHNPAVPSVQCLYIRIKLLYLLPRASTWMQVIQRHILDVPDSLPKEPEGVQVAPEHLHNYAVPIRFFRHLRFVISSSDSALIDAATSQCALRALFVANASALLGCHLAAPPQTGLVGAEFSTQQSSGGMGATAKGDVCRWWGSYDTNEESEEEGEKVLTHEDAVEFLSNVFFAFPRDGATVTCSVTRKSPLTGSELTPRRVTGVELGSMSLPLWLDASLQTMRGGERDLVGMQHDCEDDAALQCALADEARTAVLLQASVAGEMRRSSGPLQRQAAEQGIPLDASLSSPNSFSSLQTLQGNGLKGKSDLRPFSPHEVHYLVTLESFTNVHDTDAFFFVDPANCLRVVKKLEQEASALRRMGGTRQAELQRPLETDDCAEQEPRNNRHQYRSSNSGEEDAALPACATVQPMTIHCKPFGHINRPSEERGVVKAIQKLNLAVFFLTFHVNERRMPASDVPAALMQERLVALTGVFCNLYRLYKKLHHRGADALALEALSFAIVLSPESPQFWVRRGMLQRQLHEAQSAIHDLSVAKFLAEAGLRQSALLRGTEAGEGGWGVVAATRLQRILRIAETLLDELHALEEVDHATASPSHQWEEERPEE
ncbi:uncharacterized protein Tco025E_02312 [Trypanosoma conorhini]|uniref:Uncharacterized protein n=1 Tax=Trypanosoma conorhini TaxID=83891 RepID=A0A422Q583_9TRYP|nr:uncharacterized protein Tco025E_02312 [Trypanosoma conorhini]RNF25118.1 hypothetical protein Tco025E_02312 [Trypanosoma conorhini]